MCKSSPWVEEWRIPLLMCTKQLTLVETHDSVQSTRLHYFTPIQAPLQTWCWFAYILFNRPQTTTRKCLFGDVYDNALPFGFCKKKMFTRNQSNSHHWIYHSRKMTFKDAGKFYSCPSLVTDAPDIQQRWFVTPLVIILSCHQLHTQWKSCSAASNTWTWAPRGDFQFLWFDVFWQKTPVHHLVRGEKVRWNVIVYPPKNV